MSEIVGGLVRHLLTAGGGYLVAKGYADPASANAIVGGVSAAIGVGWSLWAKRNG